MKSRKITPSYLLLWPFKYFLGNKGQRRSYNWIKNHGPIPPDSEEIQLTFMGDLLGMGYERLEFSDELLNWIGSPNYLIFNLEAQVTQEKHLPLIKQSFSKTDFFEYLISKFTKTQLVAGVANNHFHDFSPMSRSHCFELLKRLGYVLRGDRLNPTLNLDPQLEIHFHTAWVDKFNGAAIIEEIDFNPNSYHILFLHLGDEFSADPNSEVIQFVKNLPFNVLAMVGHHTHRPSGIESMDGRVVAWSLGNISTPFGGHPVRWGQVIKINLKKKDLDWRISNCSWQYLYCEKMNSKSVVKLVDVYPFQK